MQKIVTFSCILLVTGLLGCSRMTISAKAGESPTEAYKLLYAAVKSKDTEAIKRQLSKRSIEFGQMAAQQQKSTPEKVFENGFTATTFSETLPTIRDERVNGDMGAVEVWNSKDSRWEDLPFVKEDGAWKLAWGDQFAGTYKSPGPGRDLIEKQAANAQGPEASSNSVPSMPMNIPPPPKHARP